MVHWISPRRDRSSAAGLLRRLLNLLAIGRGVVVAIGAPPGQAALEPGPGGRGMGQRRPVTAAAAKAGSPVAGTAVSASSPPGGLAGWGSSTGVDDGSPGVIGGALRRGRLAGMVAGRPVAKGPGQLPAPRRGVDRVNGPHGMGGPDGAVKQHCTQRRHEPRHPHLDHAHPTHPPIRRHQWPARSTRSTPGDGHTRRGLAATQSRHHLLGPSRRLSICDPNLAWWCHLGPFRVLCRGLRGPAPRRGGCSR